MCVGMFEFALKSDGSWFVCLIVMVKLTFHKFLSYSTCVFLWISYLFQIIICTHIFLLSCTRITQIHKLFWLINMFLSLITSMHVTCVQKNSSVQLISTHPWKLSPGWLDMLDKLTLRNTWTKMCWLFVISYKIDTWKVENVFFMVLYNSNMRRFAFLDSW